jgi:hypothetical protein
MPSRRKVSIIFIFFLLSALELLAKGRIYIFGYVASNKFFIMRNIRVKVRSKMTIQVHKARNEFFFKYVV